MLRNYLKNETYWRTSRQCQLTIDTAYKNKELAFNPGESVLYSNTGFNMAGIILEKETRKTVDELLSDRFKGISPSIRMDNGNVIRKLSMSIQQMT